jgi:Transposase
VTNLETGEPLWLGRERKKETLDEFFEKQLSAFQRGPLRAACVDMWEPFRQSLAQWVPECRIIYEHKAPIPQAHGPEIPPHSCGWGRAAGPGP